MEVKSSELFGLLVVTWNIVVGDRSNISPRWIGKFTAPRITRKVHLNFAIFALNQPSAYS